MKLLVTKFKVVIRCLFLGMTVFFLIDGQCCAKTLSEELYLKFELPMHTRVNFKDIENNQKQEEPDLTLSNQYTAGIGYTVSPYIEAELMLGQLELRSEESSVNTSSNDIDRPNAIRNKQLFGFAFPATSFSKASCGDIAKTFVTKEDICGAHNTCANVSGLSNSIKLNTMILSMKFNLFEQSTLFMPYFSGGTGIVFGESKNIKFSKDVVGGRSVTKRKTQTLAFEFGVGTKIKLMPKIHLEINAKYFDYGKHALKQDVFKKINGYKFSVGIVCFL